MKQPRHVSYVVDGGEGVAAIVGELPGRYQLEGPDTSNSRIRYYDTFDWRLYRKKLLFAATGGSLVLSDFKDREYGRVKGSAKTRFFWWELEESALRERLKNVIDMRALLPLSTIQSETASYRLLNRDRKTIARFALRKDSPEGDASAVIPGILTLEEIRGYDGAFDSLLEICDGLGLSAISTKKQLRTRAFSASNRTLLDYGDKFRVDLADGISVGSAVSTICLELVRAMEINHPGVVGDLDSEFLHDFRIAVRRTRSLLTLLKKLLPVEKTHYFQDEFRWLGSITGPVRDIDVYLLERDDYMALIPLSLQPGLDLFFEDLENRRSQELKELRSQLGSQRYTDLLNEWRDYLSAPDSELFSGNRAQDCKPEVDAIIRKRFKGFLRHGSRIDAASADEELHSLRIKGKKMRYLLEFFRSFYDEELMERFLKQMKRLQDNLGDFNDLSVQQEVLGTTLDALSGRNKRSVRLGAALGALIGALQVKHRAVRSDFQATFAEFSTAENRDLLERMVAGRATKGKGRYRS
jgi:CHAD domain-containing protein